MARDPNAPFTEEEIALLEKYVTSVTDDVFVVKGPQGLVGAVFARYSRARDGFRETLLNEFLKEGHVDAARADKLIARVLIEYRDDSVAELEGAHLALEKISILATKAWEDRRIGGSPIEKSTRYVFFNQRDAQGRFPYHRDREVMASPAAGVYVDGMDFIFQAYCDLIEPMIAFYKAGRPIESVRYKIREDEDPISYADCAESEEQKAFRRTYDEDIRTKTCDTLRCILPLSTHSNVGIFGNGRYFSHALTYCYSQPLSEIRDIAGKAHSALDQVMPRYVQRAAASPYLIRVREGMRALTQSLFAGAAPRDQPGVVLLDHETGYLIDALRQSGRLDPDVLRQAMRHEEDTLMIACMLYPYATLPLSQIRDRVRHFPQEMRDLIVSTYVGERKSRFDRPGRAFEDGYQYTFDLATDFGTYKDLERHRMNTQSPQLFSPRLGFAMPDDIIEAGFKSRIDACVEKAVDLHAMMVSSGFSDQSQYCTLHGSTVRWTFGSNDRALQHELELRTGPQGHPAYRKVCQEMHRLVEARSPWRSAVMQFVDHKDYVSARGDAEARQRRKEAALGIKADGDDKE